MIIKNHYSFSPTDNIHSKNKQYSTTNFRFYFLLNISENFKYTTIIYKKEEKRGSLLT